ncbi:MAG: DUF45 domain-containing protein [Candidatus Methanomethylophilaceae archaeon]|nr:DUF45 domain-containing protein [Candidatus Methanomethylophilaceae archaeon]MDD3379052.1 DUF45 domain-containing protein [Candidatus Methanomethylophilaceae archaeon]
MEAEESLRTTFAEVGKEYGFEKIEAEFMAFKEFKVRWQRSYKWAEFKVSDYLADAPLEVLKGLARSLFSRIMGQGEENYSESMVEWITSPEFSTYKQPVYLRRSRNITRSQKGDVKDLSASYDRLINMGLLERDPSVCLTWTKESNIRKVGHCSVLMRVVSISNVLDTDAIPDIVLDYCVYHELCHLLVGFDPFSNKHGEKFVSLEAKYPNQAEAEEWLKRLCMYL